MKGTTIFRALSGSKTGMDELLEQIAGKKITRTQWFILKQLAKQNGYQVELVEKRERSKAYSLFLEMEKYEILTSNLEDFKRKIVAKCSWEKMHFQNKETNEQIDIYYCKTEGETKIGVLSKTAVLPRVLHRASVYPMNEEELAFTVYEEDGAYHILTAWCQLGGEELDSVTFDNREEALEYARIRTYRGETIDCHACSSCYSDYLTEFVI